MTQLPTKLLSDHATLPTYGTADAAGMDLYADLHPRDVAGQEFPNLEFVHVIEPGERYAVPTGIGVAIPDGFYGRIAPRSGLAFKNGIDVLAGVIDKDYRGEVKAILVNLGSEPFTIKHGERIAQMVVTPYAQAVPVAVEDLDDTARGEGGFGSTGK